ncbi:hypothetical protein EVAR_89224_1 [Eumeta japonica]|uniref:Reverse transcriptase domain-containing protein n=1 Tax=Eumeta variegata TaxID=151549 RepID=A0A4C1T8M3_EUMVA|nr:hypothetical protein EVAR_89224_1 [Eumeta japonica]
MTSLIFGASSSPTSDLRTQQNAETCSDEYPNAEMAVKRDHYVDDFICSTDSVPEAAKLISDVTIVHARGFDIRERALEAIWEPECDSLGFDVTFKKLPRDIVNGKNKPTKGNFEPDHVDLRPARSSLSRDNKGCEYRDVTRLGHQDRAPRIRRRERTRVRGRRLLARGTTRRHISRSSPASHELHQTKSCRSRGSNCKRRFGLSPSDEYQKEHGIATERRVLWCDSKTVLRWIRSDPRAYKPFVAHRLAELDERSDRNEWRWVNSADNPRTTRRARTAIWSGG